MVNISQLSVFLMELKWSLGIDDVSFTVSVFPRTRDVFPSPLYY